MSTMRLTNYPTTSLFRFAVHGMFFATRAKLAKLEPIRIVTSILFGGVIPLFTITALKRDYGANVFLFRSHANYLTFYIDLCHPERSEGSLQSRGDSSLRSE